MRSKILFILHYPPPTHGAAMVGQYIKESSIINSRFKCNYINLGTSRTVAEIGSGGFKKWWRYFGILAKTLWQIIVFRPQLIYCTPTSAGAGFYKDAVVLLLAKTFGRKVVYHFHNKGVQTRQDHALDHLLYKSVFKNTKVILLAKPLYADIQKYVSEQNVYYCPNGIPDTNISSIQKRENKNIQLLFLSNLLVTKGIEVLLDACVLLQQQGYSFYCSIIGGEADWTAQDLENSITKRNLQAYVSYKGKKYGTEKKIAFANADMFVFPTFYSNECFPLVLLEAMQQALPVITTNEGGIPDMVSDKVTGYIIPKKDPVALAQKIAYLIKNPSVQKEMGRQGRLNYETQFTISHFEERMVYIFNAIINSQ